MLGIFFVFFGVLCFFGGVFLVLLDFCLFVFPGGAMSKTGNSRSDYLLAIISFRPNELNGGLMQS